MNVSGLNHKTLLLRLLLALAALLPVLPAHAQMAIKRPVADPVSPDSADVAAYYSKKHFWRVAA